MIRVSIYEGVYKVTKREVSKEHFADDELEKAKEWAKRQIDGKDLFASLWTCDSEDSQSDSLLTIIMPKEEGK